MSNFSNISELLSVKNVMRLKYGIKRKLADWMIKNTTFPNNCKTGNELDWMFKNNCPICVSEPIECLSNAEYHRKYPAHNRIQMGITTIYLCDFHLNELRKLLNK